MAHKCSVCGTPTQEFRQTIRFEAPDGASVLHDVPMHHCPKCGDHEITLGSAPRLRTEVALAIAVRPERLLPREVRFLREYLGLSCAELADTVGLSEVEVAKWEKTAENELIRPQAERLLRVLVMTAKPHTLQ